MFKAKAPARVWVGPESTLARFGLLCDLNLSTNKKAQGTNLLTANLIEKRTSQLPKTTLDRDIQNPASRLF